MLTTVTAYPMFAKACICCSMRGGGFTRFCLGEDMTRVNQRHTEFCFRIIQYEYLCMMTGSNGEITHCKALTL